MGDVCISALAIMFVFWIMTTPVQLFSVVQKHELYVETITYFYYTLAGSGLLAAYLSKRNFSKFVPYAVLLPALLHIVVAEILYGTGL